MFLFRTLIVVAFLYTLRSGTAKLPGIGLTPQQLSDTVWETSAPEQAKALGRFTERFGAPAEGYPKRIATLLSDFRDGAWTRKLNTPFLGEPLEIAAAIRKFPEIKSIIAAPDIAENGELYQRIFEGIYPTLVLEQGPTNFRLVSSSNVGNCQILAKAKEATLVQCP